MTDRSARTFTPARRVTLAALGLVACLALDMPVHRFTSDRGFNYDRTDLAQFLRTGGYLPLWFVVAGAIGLEDCRRAGRLTWRAARRGWTLAGAVLVAGILAEALKVVFRRERITESHAWYAVRPLVRPLSLRSLDTGGMSMPSSHALIAFAAAFVLGRMFPGARPALLLLAIGTGLSRIYSNAHVPSDVYVSSCVAWCVARAVAPIAVASEDLAFVALPARTGASTSAEVAA